MTDHILPTSSAPSTPISSFTLSTMNTSTGSTTTTEPEIQQALPWRNKRPVEWQDQLTRGKIGHLIDEYMEFIDRNVSPRQRVEYVRHRMVDILKFEHTDIGEGGQAYRVGIAAPGLYYDYKGLAFAIVVPGRLPGPRNLRVGLVHVDSPRMDLRVSALSDHKPSKTGLAYLREYGAFKSYQWLSRPLRMVGAGVQLDSGEMVHFDTGLDGTCTCIPDLLPHFSYVVQDGRTASKTLDIKETKAILSSIPFEACSKIKSSTLLNQDSAVTEQKAVQTGSFTKAVLSIMSSTTGLSSEDLKSAEVSLVPLVKSRKVGLDRALIGGYGHDDCASLYPAIVSITEIVHQYSLNGSLPDYPCVLFGLNCEEIGSSGVGGANTEWAMMVLRDVITRLNNNKESEIIFNQICKNSVILSADVSAGIDPLFPAAYDPPNNAVVGRGIDVEASGSGKTKGGSCETSTTTMAWFRKQWETSGIPYQLCQFGEISRSGGGSTAGIYLARKMACEMLDVGPPVLSMHSPFELVHQDDLYAMKLAWDVFFQLRADLHDEERRMTQNPQMQVRTICKKDIW